MNLSGTHIAHRATGLPRNDGFIIGPGDRILVTGAAGFIGSRVVQCLLDRGLRNLVCLVRPESDMAGIEAIIERQPPGSRIEVLKGNLLSLQDCEKASKDVSLILHLAAGVREKSFADVILNSVVATKNLLDASLRWACLRRLVLVSSFTVYSNRQKSHGKLLDESCPLEGHPELRGEAYCVAKVKQEQLVAEYGKDHGIPYVLVRPGSVYGAGRNEITGRVGIATLGPFLHLGGSNTIPFTYVENCADATVLAGLVKGVEGEAFNVVDDDLPTSRQFLRLYKKNVKSFISIYVPHLISYTLCFLWEKVSQWSAGRLPLVINRRRWHADWKKTQYSNAKLKTRLGWKPKVPTEDGMRLFFEACRGDGRSA